MRNWVAVIDDDASVRRSLGHVLSVHGVSIGMYGSAEEYLEGAMDEPPRCIVADVQLAGGMSGLELLGRLAAEADSPPFILITGLEIPDALIRVHGDRVSLLRKPFDSGRLMALLHLRLQQDAAEMLPSPADGLRPEVC